MYTVNHIVSVNGVVVDVAQSPLGIRTITWDTNYPYFNGHPMNLWGGSGRYDYPGLGSSVPEEQQWRDLSLIAARGRQYLASRPLDQPVKSLWTRPTPTAS